MTQTSSTRSMADALPGIGISLGAGAGLAIGVAIAGAPGIPVGLLLGAGIGVIIGAVGRLSGRDRTDETLRAPSVPSSK